MMIRPTILHVSERTEIKMKKVFLYSLTHFKFIANYLEQPFVNRKYHAPINMAYKQLPVAQNDDVDTSSDLDISEIDF